MALYTVLFLKRKHSKRACKCALSRLLAHLCLYTSLGESPALLDILWYLPTTDILRLMDLEADRSIERRRNSNEPSSNNLMRHLVIKASSCLYIDLLNIHQLNEDGKDIPQLKDTDLRQDAIVALAAGKHSPALAMT
jgi:hypothetical protein